jgi:hypothetical protein
MISLVSLVIFLEMHSDNISALVNLQGEAQHVTEEPTEGDEGDDEAPEEETTEDGEENGDDEAPEEEETTEDEGETPEETPPAETPATPTKTKKVVEAKEPEEEKTYICHICRSKVVKGKCTGCGFSVGG